ncbi:hypothetical protein SAMN02990966_07197 [Rhodospirillales bacterium URHD0017]|nr:hypothetical protein SAMN02990966_07197 [Rhodospirillales bacterium URHD0017]
MAKITPDAELTKSSYWRERAEEARTRADGLREPEAKAALVNVAAMYEAMANRAEERERASRT